MITFTTLPSRNHFFLFHNKWKSVSANIQSLDFRIKWSEIVTAGGPGKSGPEVDRPTRLTNPRSSTIVRLVPKYHEELDALLRALADPTRRAVVERLAKSPAVVSELAA